MKVYLDDIRDTPDGYVRAYWPEDVILLFATHRVTELSLDHDLGDDERGTGYSLVCWIENEVATNRDFVPPEIIKIHSANPIGRDRMQAGIDNIQRMVQQRG